MPAAWTWCYLAVLHGRHQPAHPRRDLHVADSQHSLIWLHIARQWLSRPRPGRCSRRHREAEPPAGTGPAGSLTAGPVLCPQRTPATDANYAENGRRPTRRCAIQAVTGRHDSSGNRSHTRPGTGVAQTFRQGADQPHLGMVSRGEEPVPDDPGSLIPGVTEQPS